MAKAMYCTVCPSRFKRARSLQYWERMGLVKQLPFGA